MTTNLTISLNLENTHGQWKYIKMYLINFLFPDETPRKNPLDEYLTKLMEFIILDFFNVPHLLSFLYARC